MTDWYNVRNSAETTPIHLSITHSAPQSLVNKTPKILKLLQFRLGLSPDLKLAIHPFQTMVSDLEVLIVIPAVSHSAENCPSAFWMSPLSEVKRTHLCLQKAKMKFWGYQSGYSTAIKVNSFLMRGCHSYLRWSKTPQPDSNAVFNRWKYNGWRL